MNLAIAILKNRHLYDEAESVLKEIRPHPAPERVLLCYGNYWTCPIDEEECKVSDPCHQKAIRDREERAEAVRQAREQVLDLIIKEAQTAHDENRKIGRATVDDLGKEYRRGCAVGNKEILEYAESLRHHSEQQGQPR